MRISPPASVQARPVAMPTSETSPFRRLRNRGLPRNSVRFSGVIAIGRLDLLLDDPAGDLAADAADLALEVAHARLAGVVLDDRAGSRRPSNSTWPSFSPLASRCFGTRNCRAIATFSLGV